MQKFGDFICKNKYKVLIVSFVLLILSLISMKMTKINYDILVYLPKDIDTIKGQNILTDDFNMGAYSIAICEKCSSNEVLKLEEKIKKVEGVNEVLSSYDALGESIPIDFIPSDIRDKVHKDDSDVLLITFSESTSSEKTLNAVKEIREITDGKIKQGGMSSVVLDTMELSNKEIVIYIIIAVMLCLLFLEFSLDSYLVPILLLGNIGCAILFNMGTNVFFGEISYITKALVAVLQLGVTTDFSIFLYHSYEKKKNEMDKEKAMSLAIKETFTSVAGSSLTTIAGFLVLCAMQLTLGKDLGIVMAKGVLLGVITVLTLFPSLLLVLDNLIEKTKHKEIIPKFKRLNEFVIKHHVALFIIFVIILPISYLANSKVDVYYKLDKSLPETLESIKTNKKLEEEFNIVSLEMVIIDKSLKTDEVSSLVKEIENVDGIDFVLSVNELKKLGITNALNSDELNMLNNDKYQVIMINSLYRTATDELNNQSDILEKIIKKYDSKGILAGEGPLTKDLIKTSDTDFQNVNIWSVVCIFIILFFVLRSVSLPFLLIIAIETAIFTNMSVSYFSGSVLPFIAPIVLGTIQLGATIDYAILLTTTYLSNRRSGLNKEEAMKEALNYSGTSIFVSGMCFFAATFGVGIYSKIEMIGAICNLIARGALISMLIVCLSLPSILLIFDKIILKTTMREEKKMNKKVVKTLGLLLILAIPLNAKALEKNETVYASLNADGSVKSVIVNEEVKNIKGLETLEDNTLLTDIINIGNDSTYKKEDSKLFWNARGKDILYQGKTDKELPVRVKTIYYLDGEEKALNSILGKQGRVTIKLIYTNLDKHFAYVNGKSDILYTPFIVTTGTILDGNVQNVEVTNGKVINNGNKNIVVALALPGMWESLRLSELKGSDTITISFDTESFELESIYSVVTPKLVEANDLSIFNKLENLYTSADVLKENMEKIENGAKEIKAGSSQIKSTLGASLKGIDTTSPALNDEQVEAIKTKTVNGVKQQLTSEYKTAVANKTWNEVKTSLNTEDENIKEYVTSSVTKMLALYLGGETNLTYYGGCLQGMNGACTALTMQGYNLSVINTYKDVLTSEFVTLALKTSSYVAENVSKQVAVNVLEQTAIQTASDVSTALAPEVANLVKETILNETKTSLTLLYEGVSKLDNGIEELINGIVKYNEEGIAPLTNMVNNNLKDASVKAKALMNYSNGYNEFASGIKTNGSTKFILNIEGKKLEKEENIKETKEVKLSLWQRIKNLFK